jgi:DNA-binding beta-propeller fold protein YncE
MFRVHSRIRSGRARRLLLGAATAATLFAAAASAQAEPFVYVTNSGDRSVSQYNIGPAGLLAPLAPPTVTTAGNLPFEVAVSPDAKSAYVTGAEFHDGRGVGIVSQYDVGPGGGLLPKSPAAVAAGNFTSGSVSQYDVAPGGALSSKSPATVAAGEGPRSVVVSPDGKSVYVTAPGTRSVSQYDVGPGGGLSPKSPGTVSARDNPFDVAVSPEGSVYVTGAEFHDGREVGIVSQYDVGPGGGLSPKSPATVAAGLGPYGVAVSPAARVPTTKHQCKHGSWKQFGFKSQGRCIPS